MQDITTRGQAHTRYYSVPTTTAIRAVRYYRTVLVEEEATKDNTSTSGKARLTLGSREDRSESTERGGRASKQALAERLNKLREGGNRLECLPAGPDSRTESISIGSLSGRSGIESGMHGHVVMYLTVPEGLRSTAARGVVLVA